MSSTSQRRSRTWAEARNESWRTEWLCCQFICSSGNFSLSVVDQAGNVPLRNSATLSLCTLKKRLVSQPFYRIPNGVRQNGLTLVLKSLMKRVFTSFLMFVLGIWIRFYPQSFTQINLL